MVSTPKHGLVGVEPAASIKMAIELPSFSATEHAALLAEVKMLADHIESTRCEIAVLAADGAVKSHVSIATDELDAVIVDTAEATDTILDVCEGLDAASPEESRAVVGAATARIYEACSFQDITGQRVAKVVGTLQAIEGKIAEILHIFGNGPAPKLFRAGGHLGSQSLLNGPQSRGSAIDQGTVDAILDSER